MTVRYSHKIHRLFNRREELIDKPTLTPEEQAEYDAISEKLDALPTCKDPDDQAAMDLIRRAAAHLKKHMPLEAALAESAATIAALQSDNAALRGALEPFAAVQEAIGQAGYTNFDATKCHITVSLDRPAPLRGHLQAGRAARGGPALAGPAPRTRRSGRGLSLRTGQGLTRPVRFVIFALED